MNRQDSIKDTVHLAALLDGVDLVIFDFDGVIADSEVISLSTLHRTIAAYGIRMTLDEVRARFLGTSLRTISEFVAEAAGSAEGFATSWQQSLYAQFRAHLRPVPGVDAMLEGLTQRDLTYCVASSSHFERIRVALDAIALAHRFAHVFSAEQVAQGKPAPDLFEFAAGAMGVAPERCVVIEDSPYGIQAARAAGMRSGGFIGGTHLDGIREAHAATLRDAGADAIIAGFSD